MSNVCYSPLGRLVDWSIQHTSYVDTPTCDVRSGTFWKRLWMANHTHTWWCNMSPLKALRFLGRKCMAFNAWYFISSWWVWLIQNVPVYRIVINRFFFWFVPTLQTKAIIFFSIKQSDIVFWKRSNGTSVDTGHSRAGTYWVKLEPLSYPCTSVLFRLQYCMSPPDRRPLSYKMSSCPQFLETPGCRADQPACRPMGLDLLSQCHGDHQLFQENIDILYVAGFHTFMIIESIYIYDATYYIDCQLKA